LVGLLCLNQTYQYQSGMIPLGYNFECWLGLMNRIKRNIAQIYFEILKVPLSAGKKVNFLIHFFPWKFFHRHRGKRWIVQLLNGLRSYGYPYPDHDAGELYTWTRNVDSYELQFERLMNTPVESFREFFKAIHRSVFTLEKGKSTHPGIVARSQNLYAASTEYFLRSIMATENAA
jgi:hypothetical protein